METSTQQPPVNRAAGNPQIDAPLPLITEDPGTGLGSTCGTAGACHLELRFSSVYLCCVVRPSLSKMTISIISQWGCHGVSEGG